MAQELESLPVYFNCFTGPPRQVVASLLRSVSAHTRDGQVAGFKIGITNDPERRFLQEHARNYAEMLVLYETGSIDYASWLETILIEHNRDLADNDAPGGGGNYGEPPYYVYIVLR